MTQAQIHPVPLTRPGGDPLGIHRVLEPRGVLPQAARRLDVSLPLFQNEMLIEVHRLNIDSASFAQLKKQAGGRRASVGKMIQKIVKQSGKMQNPVTGSGGMLAGEVFQVGPDFPGDFQV
ncbi:MAG: hypothetical protein R3257_05705, partial [bacterium]|nr:hypothetical protein [bacterium]